MAQEGLLVQAGMQFSMRIGDDDIRGNIKNVKPSHGDGIEVTAEVWAKGDSDEGWRKSSRTKFEFEGVVKKDDVVIGNFSIFPTDVEVRFLKPEDERFMSSFEAPTLTIEAALEKYGDITLDAQGSGDTFHVARIGAGEIRLPVVTESFTAPYANLVRTGIGRALIERPGVIRVEGFYKAEDGGMAHGSRSMVGWGKTLREAIAAAYRSPYDSYFDFHEKAKLTSHTSVGTCVITAIVLEDVSHHVIEYARPVMFRENLFSSLLVTDAERVNGVTRVRGTYSMPSLDIENAEWTGEGESFGQALNNGIHPLTPE